MEIRYGVRYSEAMLSHIAYMTFVDGEELHALIKCVKGDKHEEYMYNPFEKKYELCTFYSQLKLEAHKSSLRKTWKSLVEQGWGPPEDI
jgi:hypothetical protein